MTGTTGTGADHAGEYDIGVVAEVPEPHRLEEDPAYDNGLGQTGAETVDDVPLGEVHWLDGRDAS